MMIRPIGERVLIKSIKKAEVTESGIYIPDSAQEERKEGIVVGVGTFEDGKALPLKAGDHVIYGGYKSDEIDFNGETHMFIDFKDVLAVVEK
ncbi:co-chaperone GroES [Methanolobus chelungpuianus]|uniref:Co-chaperonin GroES n=1 Tax=Methanolobus chelungpuianus TaxID=502115 RepID=A0AAE3HB12_9EURY|nr:co-chaperone GroES [Methanolobus chelungpuianus]MCQ6962823.1 molecular chaperone GroES [Methanolobus chelungpuianus]